MLDLIIKNGKVGRQGCLPSLQTGLTGDRQGWACEEAAHTGRNE